jgi:uncharacterized membrane protein/predicted DsbA family dithiol-disulfide isomerase
MADLRETAPDSDVYPRTSPSADVSMPDAKWAAMSGRTRFLSALALLASIVGLGASIASLVDYLGAHPTFCAESGCATVRQSAWSHPLGIPLPAIVIAYFTIMIVLAFIERLRVMRIVLAIVGGLAALGLIALQAFSIGAWCKLCLVADPSAIVLALAVVAGASTLRPTWRASAVAPAVILVVFALGLWTHQEAPPPAPTPEAILREQKPGVVTIVEFVDFECPFCRALDKKLGEALGQYKGPVRIVRKMVPLPNHPHSVPAAMAYCACEAQGHGDAMAKELFAAPTDNLTPAGNEELAKKVGCEIPKYRETFASAELRARIEADMADARAANLEGFPTIYIGTQTFEGSDHSTAKLLAAIENAAKAAR